MKQVLVIVFAAFLALPALSQEVDTTAPDASADPGADAQEAEAAAPVFEPLNAADVSLADFQWLKRIVVVLADTPADPRFREQMDLLQARPEELIARDVVLIFDDDPAAQSEIRRKLRPRGFMLVLIGKDGGIKLRKPFPWDVREITRAIDKWPLRQQEIRDEKARAAAAEAALEAAR